MGSTPETWMTVTQALGNTYFAPVAVSTLLTGAGLVAMSGAFGFTDGFVMLGLVVWIYSAVSNSTYGRKLDQRTGEAMAAGNPDLVQQAETKRALFHVSHIALLTLVLAAMVLKLGS
ncbi:MAG: hypothetical protein KatS3mg011_1670 [Acidimicrobiia bacterium]|nr:MAG: hypothetical protein KatS3mg011_1670 [Acidimicrobiia bacterium]